MQGLYLHELCEEGGGLRGAGAKNWGDVDDVLEPKLKEDSLNVTHWSNEGYLDGEGAGGAAAATAEVATLTS